MRSERVFNPVQHCGLQTYINSFPRQQYLHELPQRGAGDLALLANNAERSFEIRPRHFDGAESAFLDLFLYGSTRHDGHHACHFHRALHGLDVVKIVLLRECHMMFPESMVNGLARRRVRPKGHKALALEVRELEFYFFGQPVTRRANDHHLVFVEYIRIDTAAGARK